MNRTALFLATGAFTGLSPIAPGTAGSLLAALLLAFIPSFSHPSFVLGTLMLVLIGIWAAAAAEAHYQKTDASQIVIDEIVGMMVSVMFLPTRWQIIGLAFVLFRVIDILKPFPIRRAEHIGTFLAARGPALARLQAFGGGLAVMLDDILAGVYVNLIIRILLWWSP